MAPMTWKVYTACFTLVVLCVLAAYHSAEAAERCVRTSGNSINVEEFQSASPSTIRKLLKEYFENRRANKPKYDVKPTYTCIPQGDSCSPTAKTPCCGRMGCYTYTGDKCVAGSRCVCRNRLYYIDPYF